MADQTVTVNLALLYDPRSGRAFTQMANEAAKASNAVNDAVARKFGKEFATRARALNEIGGVASNLGAYGAANSIGRTGSAAEGLAGAGFGGAARFAQKAAIPLAVAGAVGSTAQTVAGYAYDRYSTNAQIGRSAVRDLVPFGARAQSFADAMSGRTAGYEEAGIQSQYQQAAGQARLERSAFALSFNPQQAGREALASAYRGQSAVAPSVFDRTTAGGERAFREEQRLLPLKQAEARAEREMAQASREQLASQTELNRVKARGYELTRQRTALERRLGQSGFGSGVDRQEVLKQISDVNAELSGNLTQQRAAGDQYQNAVGSAVNARAEREKARLRTQLQGEADSLGERAQTAAGAAGRLGTMNPFDRAMGLQLTRMAQQRGSLEGLPQEYLSAIQNFAPETFRKLAEKTGAGTAEFKAGVSEFNADFAGDPETLRRREAEARRKLAEAEFGIDSEAAGNIARSFDGFGKFVGEVINQALDKQRSEILNTVRLGRNAN